MQVDANPITYEQFNANLITYKQFNANPITHKQFIANFRPDPVNVLCDTNFTRFEKFAKNWSKDLSAEWVVLIVREYIFSNQYFLFNDKSKLLPHK